MGKVGRIDQELRALIADAIAADLLAAGSSEREVAERVARSGQPALDAEQRKVWEERVLPVLSKPLNEQVAIASIIRSGGYVPRKIEV